MSPKTISGFEKNCEDGEGEAVLAVPTAMAAATVRAVLDYTAGLRNRALEFTSAFFQQARH